jgi:hypothetical protein
MTSVTDRYPGPWRLARVIADFFVAHPRLPGTA